MSFDPAIAHGLQLRLAGSIAEALQAASQLSEIGVDAEGDVVQPLRHASRGVSKITGQMYCAACERPLDPSSDLVEPFYKGVKHRNCVAGEEFRTGQKYGEDRRP